ncbi:MerR family transcriptional regulator [Actinomycetes bacterium KLBMP 9759]
MAAPAPPPPEQMWTVAAVARRLGVAPATLRSWSRRYGIGPAVHNPGRHRRYSAEDVAELDALRALTDQGMVFSAASAIVRGQRGQPGTGDHVPAPDAAPIVTRIDPVTDLVDAAARLDVPAATDIVTTSLATRGVIATWDQLCRPVFAQLDAAVTRDLGCTDAQLLLSWVITTCQRGFVQGRVPSTVRPVLLACSVGEQHTLLIEALFAALAERRLPATVLGPDVPTEALLHAVRQVSPSTVVVSAHRATTADPDVLRELVAHTGTVIAAGPGWRTHALPPAVLTANDLHVALALATC